MITSQFNTIPNSEGEAIENERIELKFQFMDKSKEKKNRNRNRTKSVYFSQINERNDVWCMY